MIVGAKGSRSDSQPVSQVRCWPRRVIRVFGVLNVLMAVFGLYLIWVELAIFVSGRHTHERYIFQAFYTMTAINFACLVVMLIAGVYLLRLRRSGLVICNYLFGFQIIYFLVVTFLPMALTDSPGALRAGDSIAAAGGIGNMGIGPQGTIVYPIVGLIFLNWAYRRLKQAGQACAG